VDGVLLQGDCGGTLHAFDISGNLHREPPRLWTLRVGGCIESTPSVWHGRIYVGSRDGGIYAIGRP
jgi:outer membrane protein assembly factor BamB